MTTYAKHVSTRRTSPTQKIPGTDQVINSGGGFSFQVDDWARLDRFLILGAVGGTYYVRENKLTKENAGAVINCVKADGMRAVNRIVEISKNGRAPKNEPAVFALALAASFGNETTKRAAFEALPEVCRIGTHLFQFAASVEQLRGWGRGLRNAVSRWYTTKSPRDLAYQVTKYQQRDGWSHRDLLRLSHASTEDSGIDAVLRYVVCGADGMGVRQVKRKVADRAEHVSRYDRVRAKLPGPIISFEQAKKATSVREIVSLIEDFDLVRECVPTQFLNSPEVWEALLRRMPLTAMLRNLGKMSSVNLLAPLSDATRKVVDALTDPESLKKARVHPLAILVALRTYAQGHGEKGSLTWSPVPQVVDALNDGVYLAFDAVEPTGKRFYLGVDVSGSMSAPIAGTPLSCCEAATALAMVTAHTERNYFIGAFSNGITQLPFSRGMRLDDALRHTRNVNFGGTNCSLPMVDALRKRLPVDVFQVLTDSETYLGDMHPCQALRQYRQQMGIPAKLVVAGMASNGFTIADPDDGGMLDVCGFSTDTPSVITEFAKGSI